MDQKSTKYGQNMNKVRVKLIRNWTQIGHKLDRNSQKMTKIWSEMRWDKRWQENGLSQLGKKKDRQLSKNGQKMGKNGQNINRVWAKLNRKWTDNGLNIDKKWPKYEQCLGKIEQKMDHKWTKNGQKMART